MVGDPEPVLVEFLRDRLEPMGVAVTFEEGFADGAYRVFSHVLLTRQLVPGRKGVLGEGMVCLNCHPAGFTLILQVFCGPGDSAASRWELVEVVDVGEPGFDLEDVVQVWVLFLLWWEEETGHGV